MKKLFLIALLFASCANIFAQEEKSVYPTKGYRGSGFIYYAGNGDDYESISIGSTHGYQINPKLFIGGGLHLNFGSWSYRNEDFSLVSFTPYSAIRFDMVQKKISPYLSLRLGVTGGDITGFYAAPEFGVRFSHFNLGVGVELQDHDADYGQGFYVDNATSSSLFMVRLAYDFMGRKK